MQVRFELELFGGGVEKRYRLERPEVLAMPWSSYDPSRLSEQARLRARRDWTASAFQEYRTAAACAATVEALVAASAPIDLTAMATRFPLDEMVHVELCARMAMLCGGGTEILYNDGELFPRADSKLPPLLRLADMVIRFFCIGETASVPQLRQAWKNTKSALPKAILGRIVKDEAAHGAFGWLFLDWALPRLDASDLTHLGQAADRGIKGLKILWDDVRARRTEQGLGVDKPDPYFILAERTLAEKIIAPLRARNIRVS